MYLLFEDIIFGTWHLIWNRIWESRSWCLTGLIVSSKGKLSRTKCYLVLNEISRSIPLTKGLFSKIKWFLPCLSLDFSILPLLETQAVCLEYTLCPIWFVICSYLGICQSREVCELTNISVSETFLWTTPITMWVAEVAHRACAQQEKRCIADKGKWQRQRSVCI